jgi:hypothetical protein
LLQDCNKKIVTIFFVTKHLLQLFKEYKFFGIQM